MAERPDSRAELEELTRAVFRLAAAVGQQAHRSLGLGATDVAALQTLDRAAAGPVRLGRLAAGLGLSSAATTELADRLERAGLVRRERDPQDRRQVLLALEPAARRVGERLLEPWTSRIREAVDVLDAEERRAVGRFLTRLLADPLP